MYGKNPIVTVSSREVYDFLINKGVELNIAHLPLSISDRYKISDTTRFVKKYDLVLMGRQNPVLEQYLHRYVSTHHDFVYVYRNVSVTNSCISRQKENRWETSIRGDYIWI